MAQVQALAACTGARTRRHDFRVEPIERSTHPRRGHVVSAIAHADVVMASARAALRARSAPLRGDAAADVARAAAGRPVLREAGEHDRHRPRASVAARQADVTGCRTAPIASWSMPPRSRSGPAGWAGTLIDPIKTTVVHAPALDDDVGRANDADRMIGEWISCRSCSRITARWAAERVKRDPTFFTRLEKQQAPGVPVDRLLRQPRAGQRDRRPRSRRAVRAPQRRQRGRAHRPQLPVGAAVCGRRAEGRST